MKLNGCRGHAANQTVRENEECELKLHVALTHLVAETVSQSVVILAVGERKRGHVLAGGSRWFR